MKIVKEVKQLSLSESSPPLLKGASHPRALPLPSFLQNKIIVAFLCLSFKKLKLMLNPLHDISIYVELSKSEAVDKKKKKNSLKFFAEHL